MAETRLARDTATTSWSTTTLTAGLATDSFYVDKGDNGPRSITAVLSFPTPGSAVQVDLQVSTGGVIWNTIYSITNIGGDTFKFPAPQGFFRFVAVSFTGAPTATLVLTARTVDATVVLGSVGTPGGVTEGAVLQAGTAAIPLVQDTANTAFISGNFKNDATTGSTFGLRMTLDVGGLLQTFSTAIHGQLNVTEQVRNPVAVQGDITFSTGAWIQGLGYGVGTYITLPGSAETTGTFAGINVEVAASASFTKGASPIMSLFRAGFSGDQTAIDNIEDSAYLLELFGLTEGTGNLMSEGADQAATGSLRIRVGTNVRYLLYSSTQTT